MVVFWSPFEARLIDGDKITFVHGDELLEWLRSRPRKLSDATIEAIAEQIG